VSSSGSDTAPLFWESLPIPQKGSHTIIQGSTAAIGVSGAVSGAIASSLAYQTIVDTSWSAANASVSYALENISTHSFPASEPTSDSLPRVSQSVFANSTSPGIISNSTVPSEAVQTPISPSGTPLQTTSARPANLPTNYLVSFATPADHAPTVISNPPSSQLTLTPANDFVATVFSLLPNSSFAVQLVSAGPPTPVNKSISVVVVTKTAYRIKYITITIFHTTSVSGYATISAETTTIGIATQASETYVLISPPMEATIPTPTAQSSRTRASSSHLNFGGSFPGVSESASFTGTSESAYATISGFKIVPMSSSMTVKFLGASPVTAIMATESPVSGPNESFIPLWVPEMLGNAYGGGWNMRPLIWVLSPSESPVDVRGAAVAPGLSSEAVELSGLEMPATSMNSTPQFITLIPGTSYSFSVPLPPMLEPIPVVSSSVTQPGIVPDGTTEPAIKSTSQPAVTSLSGNLSSIHVIIPPPPPMTAWSNRTSVEWFMGIFSFLAVLVLI
jgi:hypothetical protein